MLEQRVQQLVGARHRCADAPIEDVERDDGRDRDEQTDGRGDQRLGDAGHDDRHAARLVAGEIVERLDDAQDRAEQPDERRVVAERAEEGQVPLELDALARLALLQTFDDRVDAVGVLGQARLGDRALDAVRVAQARARLLDVAGLDELGQLARQRPDVEAVLLEKVVRERNLKSILPVTSAYHTRRTLSTFQKVFGEKIEIGIAAPEIPTPSPDYWWLFRQGWRNIALEYLKICYYWLYY